MIESDISIQNAGEAAAMLGWTLRDDPRWTQWYDPDQWAGMVGLMNYLAAAAIALEEQLDDRSWSDLDWYSTINAVAQSIFDGTLDLTDMSPYYVEL